MWMKVMSYWFLNVMVYIVLKIIQMLYKHEKNIIKNWRQVGNVLQKVYTSYL